MDFWFCCVAAWQPADSILIKPLGEKDDGDGGGGGRRDLKKLRGRPHRKWILGRAAVFMSYLRIHSTYNITALC